VVELMDEPDIKLLLREFERKLTDAELWVALEGSPEGDNHDMENNDE